MRFLLHDLPARAAFFASLSFVFVCVGFYIVDPPPCWPLMSVTLPFSRCLTLFFFLTLCPLSFFFFGHYVALDPTLPFFPPPPPSPMFYFGVLIRFDFFLLCYSTFCCTRQAAPTASPLSVGPPFFFLVNSFA